MPIVYKKTMLAYAPLALLAAGLVGCAPAYMPEPVYSVPPQAMPLEPMPLPIPPQVQVHAPLPVQQQPPRFYPPPTVTPIEARTKIVAEPLPERGSTKQPSGPAVTYIPEKQPAPRGQTQSSTQTKSVDVPFWDQGKVQVEVFDLPAEKTAPPQTVTDTAQLGSSPSPTTSSTTQTTSSSPAVTVLLKQANNELSVGKPDRAATTIERALRIAPNDANLWLRLAEVNEQMGNKAQASSMARKALDLAPNDVAIRLRAQRLVN